jgi:hypothetical protein
MRAAEPVHHVELRPDKQGNPGVVLAFPYRADIVDLVRAIPGRRFDWERKEWWALRSDVTAPHVKGVLERHPALSAAPDVHEWLAEAASGWAGTVGAGRLDGAGAFLAHPISGELPEPLAAAAVDRGGRIWLPFTTAVAEALLDLPGARLDTAALRCASRLQVGLDPPAAELSLVDSVAEKRFVLDTNWDGDPARAFVSLPGADGGRSLPLDPFLIEPLEHFMRTYGVAPAPNARGELERLRAEHDAAVDDIRRSRAASGPPLAVEPSLGGELRPFQRAGVAYVLDARRTFLADEQGLGKTIQALAALEADDAFPALIVCPASIKLNWEREAHHWLPHRSVAVLSGTGGAVPVADLIVCNYDILHAHTAALLLRRPRALILDESHYVKNARARRTKAVRRIADQLPKDALRLALTGTPVMNHPEELIPQLRVLGRLEEFGSGARFARRFRGAGAEERIHWHLRRSCFVRRLKADVLPQLPAKERVVVPVALDNERDYRLAERDVIAWLREQPLDLSEVDRKVAAALRAQRLAQLNALKRLAAAGKTAAALAWIEDFLESEEPLVVFSGNRDVQQRLLARFPEAHHVLGSDDAAARDKAVRAFQAGEGSPLMVGATRAAGHGITLTRAANVAFLDLEWTPAMHDQAEDRCHRIGQHDAVTAWYLLAAGTIDETISDLIAKKRAIVGAVTDGRREDATAIIEGVVQALRGKPVRHLRPVA